jgi:putative thioredoxin
MSEHPNLFAVGSADFDARVLEPSHTCPVLVDFWAAWCGPCRSLAPVLEQLAERNRDALLIAKVDTDAESALAGRYGIRSLPTLVLFKDGKPAEQVVGAQPLQALEALVKRHVVRESDRICAAATAARNAGELATARSLLEQALAVDPENFRLAPEYAAVLLDLGELDAAAAALESVPARGASDALAHQQARLRFARLALDSPTRAVLEQQVTQGDADSATRFNLAVTQLRDGDYDAGLEGLLGIVSRDRAFGDDAARKLMIDVFALLPAEDPRIREYRTRLARAIN